MARKLKKLRQHNKKPQPQPQPQPQYKKIWYVITFLIGILSAIILNLPNILENLRNLPTGYSKTVNDFMTWKSEDSQWEGKYIVNPEGYLETIETSNVEAEIVVWSEQGEISGTIVTPFICENLNFLKYAQFNGKVKTLNSNKAEIEVWDYVEGERVALGKFLLIRNSPAVKIIKLDNSPLLDQNIILAKDGNIHKNEINPDYDFCSK